MAKRKARARRRHEGLARLFNTIELTVIEGIAVSEMRPKDIADLLPPFGGKHPTKAILIDNKTGKAYGIASGWDADTVAHEHLRFTSGAIRPEMAAQAGDSWVALGNHVEAIAAAFMRKAGIDDVTLVINGRNPCWGTPDGTGCFYRMGEFLAEGSRMTVYNQFGLDFIASRRDRIFRFTGLAD